MGSPPKPSASGFGGERRCDGVSETCPASQGRGEGYKVCTDESEGLIKWKGLLQNHNFATGPWTITRTLLCIGCARASVSFFVGADHPTGREMIPYGI